MLPPPWQRSAAMQTLIHTTQINLIATNGIDVMHSGKIVLIDPVRPTQDLKLKMCVYTYTSYLI